MNRDGSPRTGEVRDILDRKTIIEYYNRPEYIDSAFAHSFRESHKQRKLGVLREYSEDDGRAIGELGCGAGVYVEDRRGRMMG